MSLFPKKIQRSLPSTDSPSSLEDTASEDSTKLMAVIAQLQRMEKRMDYLEKHLYLLPEDDADDFYGGSV